jgi:hypothetical protein
MASLNILKAIINRLDEPLSFGYISILVGVKFYNSGLYLSVLFLSQNQHTKILYGEDQVFYQDRTYYIQRIPGRDQKRIYDLFFWVLA